MAWDSLVSLVGVCITIHRSGSEKVYLKGVFSDSTLKVESESGLSVRTSNPSVRIRWPEQVLAGWHLSAKGGLFQIVEVIPDGHGGSTLELHRLEGL